MLSFLEGQGPWNHDTRPQRSSKDLFTCRKELVSFAVMELLNSIGLGWASLVAWTVKHLSAIQETQVQSLGWEDPLEKGMATHSSEWRIPWTEEPGRLQSMGLQRIGYDLTLSLSQD